MDDNYKLPMQKYTQIGDVKNETWKAIIGTWKDIIGMSGKWIYLVSISLFFCLSNFFFKLIGWFLLRVFNCSKLVKPNVYHFVRKIQIFTSPVLYCFSPIFILIKLLKLCLPYKSSIGHFLGLHQSILPWGFNYITALPISFSFLPIMWPNHCTLGLP